MYLMKCCFYFLFRWTTDIFRLGWNKSLEDTDLYEIPRDLDCEDGTELLGKLWEEEKRTKTNPNIIRVISKAYGKGFLPFGFFCALLETTLKYETKSLYF